MIRISEIEIKKVINTTDGRILGQIEDFDIDPTEGKIRSIVLPTYTKGLFFRKKETISIPWHEIKKIGFDVILAESKGQNIPDFLLDHTLDL
ncbi:MAG: YlmC/YmxH family sporulation protein [Firmicutes bacterium]|nr:YlmC/YmxH family sporulation protein [Bacillota bacterium]